MHYLVPFLPGAHLESLILGGGEQADLYHSMVCWATQTRGCAFHALRQGWVHLFFWAHFPSESHNLHPAALSVVTKTHEETSSRTMQWARVQEESFVSWEAGQAAKRLKLRGSHAILHVLGVEGWSPPFHCRRIELQIILANDIACSQVLRHPWVPSARHWNGLSIHLALYL